MKQILILIAVFPLAVLGQTKMSIPYACSYFGEKLPTEIYSFSSDNEAQTALARIMNASGLPANFKLVAGNVPNASATLIWNDKTKGFDRYIIYNQTFMSKIKFATNDWAALSILAHEIGHHLSGHSLHKGGSRPEIELEADKFSGFILHKLGSSLPEAQTAIQLLASENSSVTHPAKSARLAAIANGWFSSSQDKQSAKKSAAQKPQEIGKYDSPGGTTFLENPVWCKKVNENTFIITCEGYTFNESKGELVLYKAGTNLIIYFYDYQKYFFFEDMVSKPSSNETEFKLQPVAYANKSKVVGINFPNGIVVLYQGKPTKVVSQNWKNYGGINDIMWVVQLENGVQASIWKQWIDKTALYHPYQGSIN